MKRYVSVALVAVVVFAFGVSSCGKKGAKGKGNPAEEYVSLMEQVVKIIDANKNDAKKLAEELNKFADENNDRIKELSNDPDVKNFSKLLEKSAGGDASAKKELESKYGNLGDRAMKVFTDLMSLAFSAPALQDPEVQKALNAIKFE